MKKISSILIIFILFLTTNPVIAAEKSDPLDPSNIVIENNFQEADKITVSGLVAGSIIKVYKDETTRTPIGYTVVKNGDNQAIINIRQIGTEDGLLLMSITNPGKVESDKIEVDFNKEPKTGVLNPGMITVVNNASTSDIVTVTGLSYGDIVKVYSDAVSSNVIGTAAVLNGKTEAVVRIPQITGVNGKIYITVKSKTANESERISVDYQDEKKSVALQASNIEITNNIEGKADIIKVTGLMAKDIIKVYINNEAVTPFCSGTVANGSTEIIIRTAQISESAGSVYITLTRQNEQESQRVEKAFEAEEVSSKLLSSNINITNNVGSADNIKVTGLTAGDVIKVYKNSSATPIGSGKVSSGRTEATINIAQLGVEAGKIYLTLTSEDKLESDKLEVDFAAETTSTPPTDSKITVTNNIKGKADTVKVIDLTPGDIVKVYKDEVSTTTLGTGKVATGSTEAVVSITQLGADGGSVFITIAKVGQKESERIEKAFSAEAITEALEISTVTITNNIGMQDTIKVVGLTAGDVIKAYKSGSFEVIGSTSVAAGKTETVISVKQLGVNAGTIFLTLKNRDKLESGKLEVAFAEEATSIAPDINSIIVTNNVGKSDTVKVTGLIAGDLIKVYKDDTSATAIGSIKVASGATEAAVNISQLGTTAGSIYVSVTRTGQRESLRTEKNFLAEAVTNMLESSAITVTNNVEISDTIKVAGLVAGDIVKVYSNVTNVMIGSSTVATGKTEATISIKQLGENAGKIFLTLTSKGNLESGKLEVGYEAEATSIAPATDTITVVNNASKKDTVQVANLTTGDIVKVYKDNTTTATLGTTKVGAGTTEAIISISQLGTTEGSVYITITNVGKKESARVKVNYDKE